MPGLGGLEAVDEGGQARIEAGGTRYDVRQMTAPSGTRLGRSPGDLPSGVPRTLSGFAR